MNDQSITFNVEKHMSPISLVLISVVIYMLGDTFFVPLAMANTPDDSDWAQHPVERPDIPTVDNPIWNEHPVDAFIYDQLRQAGLQPSTMASKPVLAGRLIHLIAERYHAAHSERDSTQAV